MTESTLFTIRIGQSIVTCCHCSPIWPIPPSRNCPPVSAPELLAPLPLFAVDVALAAGLAAGAVAANAGVSCRMSEAAPVAAQPLSKRMPETTTGPVPVEKAWDAFADDQLGLMDHLGIRQFFYMGYCIGGCFAGKLLQRAPERDAPVVLALLAEQRRTNRLLAGLAWAAFGFLLGMVLVRVWMGL